MNYRIIVDSCCDLPKKFHKDPHFVFVPLTLMIEDVSIVDDETFDQADFIKRVAESKECPRSACPAPEVYEKACEIDDTDIYMVTLSSKLSGSHQSAAIGANDYKENGGKNNVHVFDSESASCGEGLIAYKILEYINAGLEFNDVVKEVEKYRDNMKTYFVLETLDSLKKNGRLNNLQSLFITILSIKPVMSAIKGEIIKLSQARGMNKALLLMCSNVIEQAGDTTSKVLSIAHCNCPERALFVKQEFQKLAKFKDIIIVETAGVATLYSSDGGIVVAV